jgi:hypothetical protein
MIALARGGNDIAVIHFVKRRRAPGRQIALQVINPKAYAVNTALFSGLRLSLPPAQRSGETGLKFAILNVIWVPSSTWHGWPPGSGPRRLDLAPGVQAGISPSISRWPLPPRRDAGSSWHWRWRAAGYRGQGSRRGWCRSRRRNDPGQVTWCRWGAADGALHARFTGVRRMCRTRVRPRREIALTIHNHMVDTAIRPAHFGKEILQKSAFRARNTVSPCGSLR